MSVENPYHDYPYEGYEPERGCEDWEDYRDRGYPEAPYGPRYPYRPAVDPNQVRRLLAPVVSHGMRELQAGVPVRHVMDEVAAGGYLVGRGYTPRQAIAAVEQWEYRYGWPMY